MPVPVEGEGYQSYIALRVKYAKNPRVIERMKKRWDMAYYWADRYVEGYQDGSGGSWPEWWTTNTTDDFCYMVALNSVPKKGGEKLLGELWEEFKRNRQEDHQISELLTPTD